MKEIIFGIASILIGIFFHLVTQSKSALMVGSLVSLFGLYILDGLDEVMKELKKRDRD